MLSARSNGATDAPGPRISIWDAPSADPAVEIPGYSWVCLGREDADQLDPYALEEFDSPAAFSEGARLVEAWIFRFEHDPRNRDRRGSSEQDIAPVD